MSIKQKIQGIIKEGLDRLNINIEINQIIIENPKDNKHGDYSTNIALVLTKILKDNPMNIANKIVAEITDETIEKIANQYNISRSSVAMTISKAKLKLYRQLIEFKDGYIKRRKTPYIKYKK